MLSLRLVIANPCLADLQTFFWFKTCVSVHITLNFAWFPLLSGQKLYDRPLFKTGALCVIWIASKQIFCKIKIIFAINQYQPMQTLHLWKKKNSEKYVILHFQNISFYWRILAYIYMYVCMCVYNIYEDL